jgi:flagellar biosynthesis/type III secretory pathway protein FliH
MPTICPYKFMSNQQNDIVAESAYEAGYDKGYQDGYEEATRKELLVTIDEYDTTTNNNAGAGR